MKKKNNSQTQVTRGELREELSRLEGRLEKKFITKPELTFGLEELKIEIDERARQYRDDVLTKLDGVMGELQTMREENTVGTHQISELAERVDDHEVRITTLEKQGRKRREIAYSAT